MIALAVVALAAALPATALAAKRSCSARGTIVANGKVTVFRLGDGRVYACWQRTGRRTLLAREKAVEAPVGENIDVEHVDASGRYVGFAVSILTDPDSQQGSVTVIDARTGRKKYKTGLKNGLRAEALVLAANGGVAWFADIETVEAIDSQGRRVLYTTTAENVSVASLAASGNTIYWTAAAAPLSAKLT